LSLGLMIGPHPVQNSRVRNPQNKNKHLAPFCSANRFWQGQSARGLLDW
jgi:hypothetical protein